MHTTPASGANGDPRARTANLLGALALEVLGAQERAIGDALGQRGAAAGALVTIHKYPDRSVEELREPLGLSQPGAARLVDRLVRSGWVERAGPGGRRGLRLRLTPAGDEMFDRLLRARRAALDEMLEPLPDVDREQLDGLLARLLGARTETHEDTVRLCRVCERRVCARCPVARAASEKRRGTARGGG